MLSARKEKGTLPENPLMTKSFVSTPLINLVAEKYGCKVVDVLTGFKYVGEFISKLEKKGEDLYITFGSNSLKLPAEKASNPVLKDYVGKEVVLGIRPEDIYDSQMGEEEKNHG